MSNDRDPVPDLSYSLPVILEDDPIHVGPYPFCSDPTCQCHEEPLFITGQVAQDVQNGLLTLDEAARIVSGTQL